MARRHTSRLGRTGSRYSHPSHHVNTHALQGRHAHNGNILNHGANSLHAGPHFNSGVGVTRGHAGQITQGTFQGHSLSHQVLGNRHRGLVGHTSKRPGSHLRVRLAKLHGYHWHRHFKHVVIAWAFGGAAVCDFYCDFDVPVDVYGDFVEAVAEAAEEDAEAAAFAQEEAGLANVSAQDLPRRRVERSHGWNKAVAILEEAAVNDGRKAADARVEGGEVETVIDQPDEQVDVVWDGSGQNGAQKKGS